MKNLILCVLIIFLLFSCKKKEVVDKDVSRINSSYSKLSTPAKKIYLDSVRSTVLSLNSATVKINSLFEIAAEYYYINETKASLESSRIIFDLAKKNFDSVSMGRSLYYIGDCFENYKKDSAYFYYKESEKIFRLLKNDEKLAKALFNKAHLLFTEGNYVESEVEVIKALQRLKKSDRNDLIFKCYFLQASNHIELEEFDNAIYYINLSKESLEKLKNSSNDEKLYKEYSELIITALCNLFDKKKDYKSSISLLKKLATPQLKDQNLLFYSRVIGNLAYANMKIGNYKDAKKQFEESIAIAKHGNSADGYLFKIISFGEYYLLTGDTLTANSYLNIALPLSKKLKSSSNQLQTLKLLSVSDLKNSSFYKSEYLHVSDSITKQQRSNREKFTRIEYETEKVDSMNKVLTKKNLVLIFGLIVCIIVFLTFIIFRNHLTRKKELFLILQKEKANDELFTLIKDFQVALVKAKDDEKNRISRELHDGVVNQIYAIRMVLETLNGKEDVVNQDKRLVYIKELNKVESEIRELSHEMHTDDSSYDTSFVFLLNSLLATNIGLMNTNFHAEISERIDWDSYSSIIKIAIYRILQEAFLNVNKYSNAQNCFIKIYETTDYLVVKCKDDGVGYDILQLTEGIGLKNMKTRATIIGATLTITAAVTKGVEIILKIKRN